MKKGWLISLFTFLVISYLPAQTNSAELNWLQAAKSENEVPSMDYFFEVVRKDPRPFTMSKIKTANKLGDFVDGFPSGWLNKDMNVEITTSYQGQIRKAVSLGEILSTEQKALLKSCNLYSKIHVSVKYQSENVVTHQQEPRNMEIKGTVFPDSEATFVGGEMELNNYLRKQIENQISDKGQLQSVKALIGFTINEEGNIVDVNIVKSTGANKTDKLLIGIISKMPVWIPASEKNGNRVKQDFVFTLGNSGC